MAAKDDLLRDPAIAGPLGSLLLSAVQPRASTLTLRALVWQRHLVRLGVLLPLVAVHDFGLILACPHEQLGIEPRPGAAEALDREAHPRDLVTRWHALVLEATESEVARRARSLGLDDDLTAVLLGRLLGPSAARVQVQAPRSLDVPLDAGLVERAERALPALFRATDRRFDVAALETLLEARLQLLTALDALDLDTLQLFGLLGGDAGSGALAQVDLFSLLGQPEANDVVNFSLEILPSVLESKARPGSGVVPEHGYSGLAKKGSVDSLVPTELAWDEPELLRRFADQELLYYARETARETARRVHHLLIDASASMRGERATFARGMALATAKKLLLAGEDVVLRFFDSRLCEPHPARAGRLPVAWLLSFKGERGRNPTRVFTDLATSLELEALRDPRDPVVTFFSHAALYIPREIVLAITRRAQIVGVFMLPSDGELALDYLDLLHAHHSVDHAALASRSARVDRARSILGAVQPRPQSSTPPPSGAAP